MSSGTSPSPADKSTCGHSEAGRGWGWSGSAAKARLRRGDVFRDQGLPPFQPWGLCNDSSNPHGLMTPSRPGSHEPSHFPWPFSPRAKCFTLCWDLSEF